MSNIKNDLEGLERGLISRAMKTIIYTLPIALLAHQVYVHFAHNDAILHVGFNFNHFITELDFHAALYSFMFFCLTFLVCYSLEIYWIPLLVAAFYQPKTKVVIPDNAVKITERIITQKEGFNALKYIHIVPKGVIIKDISGVGITIILWMVYIGNLFSYLFIVIVVYVCFAIFKSICAWYEYYPRENLKELNDTTQP